MNFRPRSVALAIVALLVVTAAGCAKKPAATPPVPPASTQKDTPVPPPVTPQPPVSQPEPTQPGVTARDLQVVYFGYDSFTLDDGARAALDNNAKMLRDNAALEVSIDGHCDERGTVEYNQALGQKRAETVQQYLMDAGIASNRFRVISYGKERPADEGHDESAWSKNRRVEF
ncbi:MAG: peptidoglycan-associated lipoprotein Pal, partial [Candidatus Eisenbacteria bacterium]